ncbi:hypothetical protein ROHU_006461 [Labeo rohita]|uniref:Uncharacterized protein n=1 Tax=Labeo rohita TaxID=84645 RepID=A0A498MUG5_LABRO|nr:hypothetical protein ROHU_006461 [Labeo rohita]
MVVVKLKRVVPVVDNTMVMVNLKRGKLSSLCLLACCLLCSRSSEDGEVPVVSTVVSAVNLLSNTVKIERYLLSAL